MLTKLALIIFLVIPAEGRDPVQPNQTKTKIYKWGTGVETPLCYTSKILSGKHGILIEGVQYISKRSKVTYEIVKRGFWEDKIYNKIEVNHSGGFFGELRAPKNEYQIKICGDHMAHGILKMTPF